VILISSLPPDKARKLFFIPIENISQALNYVKDKYGEDFQAYILPSGNVVLPKLIREYGITTISLKKFFIIKYYEFILNYFKKYF